MASSSIHKQKIKQHFSNAKNYDGYARVQKISAHKLMRMIDYYYAYLDLPPPTRILDIGCGSGFLTKALKTRFPHAVCIAVDLSEEMVLRARKNCEAFSSLFFAVMDGEQLSFNEPFDLICSNLCFQWFNKRVASLQSIYHLLSPGGMLAATTLAEGSFNEWQACCQAVGVSSGIPSYPAVTVLNQELPLNGHGQWKNETLVESVSDGLTFLQTLKAIGAQTPKQAYKPLSTGKLRQVIRNFDEAGGKGITYNVAYGWFRKAPYRGVFITGTDTGVGKTIVSASFVTAWQAAYWKPFQTGVMDDLPDSDRIKTLTRTKPAILPSLLVLKASLAPYEAMVLEGTHYHFKDIVFPASYISSRETVVIEGAGGIMVPLTENTLMLDAIIKLGMPVIVVARSELGTINHTLLTLKVLCEAGVRVVGIVMNGPKALHNRMAIEKRSSIPVIAEFDWKKNGVEQRDIEKFATLLPSFLTLTEQK